MYVRSAISSCDQFILRLCCVFSGNFSSLVPVIPRVNSICDPVLLALSLAHHRIYGAFYHDGILLNFGCDSLSLYLSISVSLHQPCYVCSFVVAGFSRYYQVFQHFNEIPLNSDNKIFYWNAVSSSSPQLVFIFTV